MCLAVAVAVAMVWASGCASSTPEDSPRSVLEVTTEFEAHGIRLTPIGEEEGVALLGLPDSDQLVAAVYPTTEEALDDARDQTERELEHEMKVGDNIIFMTRNVVVIYDSSVSDYPVETVRDAMANLE